MVNVWLIVVMVVLPLLLIAGNIYFIVHFQHPEDKGTSWLAKGTVLVSLELAEICVLMLPLDVANQGPPYGGIPMDQFWLAWYCIISIFSILVLPFGMVFYFILLFF